MCTEQLEIEVRCPMRQGIPPHVKDRHYTRHLKKKLIYCTKNELQGINIL